MGTVRTKVSFTWIFLCYVLFSGFFLNSQCNRLKRQEDVTTTSAPESTESFGDFLNDMLKSLGLDSDDTSLTEGDTLGPDGDTLSNNTNANDTVFEGTSEPQVSPDLLLGSTNDLTQNASESDRIQVTLSGAMSVINNTGTISSTSTPILSVENQTSKVGTSPPGDDQANISPMIWISTPKTKSSTLNPTLTPTPYADNSMDSATESPAPAQENPNCQVRPVLTDFCIIPDELLDFLGPLADLHDLSDYVISMHVVNDLTEKCPPGSWCLKSIHSYRHLEEVMSFWSNSSDFMSICWQSLDGCLRSVVEYYTDCHIYQMYDLIAETKKLLCEMREEPKASRDCMEQTMKALHVSMADFHRDDIEAGENNSDLCKTRNAEMTGNYLCAVNHCGDYADLLNRFKPWEFFMADVPSLADSCHYDNDKCTPEIENEADEEEEQKEVMESQITESPKPEDHQESTQSDDGTTGEQSQEDQEYNAILALSRLDVPTIIIVCAISFATLGFFFLVGVVWCLRRRKSKYRVREGVEYMEILPDTDD